MNDDAKHRCTGPERILANIVEPLVWEKVVNLLSDPFRAKRIVDEAKRLHGQKGRAQDLERLTSKIAQIDSQTEALAEHLANLPKGVSPTPIFNQMKKLEETKDMLRSELGAIERTLDESAMPVDLAGYEEFLAALKRGLNTVGEVAKAEIIQKVVSKVEIHPDSATIYYRVSKGETRPPEVAPLGEPKATSQSPEAGEGQKVATPTFFKNRGSTTCVRPDR